MKTHWFASFKRAGTALLGLTTLCANVTLAAAQTATRATAQSGESVALTMHEVVLDDLPQLIAPTRLTPVEIPMRGPNFGNWPGRGTSLNGPGGSVSPVVVENPPTPPTLKAFLGEDESACGFFIPSDHALATNSANEVQVINECITVFNTAGAKLAGYPKSLNTFFGVAGDSIGDPRTLYDWHNQRWIIMAEDFTANNILVAASVTPIVTGSYHIYTLSGTTGGQLPGCADFPMLGQTVNETKDVKGAIYVSFDRFNCSSGAFIDDVVWALPKTPIYAGANFGFNFFFNLNVGGKTVDHVQPANVMGKADEPTSEFLIDTFDFNSGCAFPTKCNGLVVWALYHGIGAGAALTGVVIGTANNYVQPSTAAQPGAAGGSACGLNTGFVGISGGVTWSAGDIYAATTSGNLNGNPQDGWIFWQVHPYLNTAGAITSATIRNEIGWGLNGFFGDATYSEYYATPQPDDEGNVTVVFNYSSGSIFPSMGFISQRTTQPTGSFPDGGLGLVGGSAFYCQQDIFGRNRWGDYTGTSPFGPAVAPYPEFWFAAQFSESSGNWGTEIGRNGYVNPASQ